MRKINDTLHSVLYNAERAARTSLDEIFGDAMEAIQDEWDEEIAAEDNTIEELLLENERLKATLASVATEKTE